jgi:hypothetical protein
MSPSQDMVMGCYYITTVLPDRKGEGMVLLARGSRPGLLAGRDRHARKITSAARTLCARVKERSRANQGSAD